MTTRTTLATMGAFSLAVALAAQETVWETYSDETYGVSMLLPEGTTLEEREARGGWGELYGRHEGVEFAVLAKLGAFAREDELAELADRAYPGLPRQWELTDSGENSNGWKWYKTYSAELGGRLYLTGLGHGTRGSYLVVLRTTPADYAAHEQDYATWYESVRLF